MTRAEQVGSGHCSVPKSFDNAHGGYSEAPPQEPPERQWNPDRSLCLAILERAVSDCRAPTASSAGASGAMLHDRQEAQRFLLDQRGERARWRRKLCELAGIEPAAFDRVVAAESAHWPELDVKANQQAKAQRRQSQAAYQERVKASRREQSRLAMLAKRAREQAAKPEPYHRRALLAGSGITRPTYTD